MIYGRRRVGKGELVKQAIRQSEIKSVYYECKQVTEAINVKLTGIIWIYGGQK